MVTILVVSFAVVIEVPSALRLETQQAPAILHLCLKKTRAEKSRDYGDHAKPAFSNISGLRFERFRKSPFS